ncbi:1efa7c44-e461-4426-b87d-424147c100c9 [Sclerotinia trifoliorum]|uniref:1efa7c44-e461-4426-b87d-424147c100c9 n=1 Tax=Sclerotinia trifoliorum TaxID=28548 RepID=A0A8H2W2T0_9HELO|nr:1efa7c44-e461-4426-b87d-424147c100c9 [Sclerotinia trifoliorum]
MARSLATQRWPALIRNARTTTEQIANLRALKNEIVGHAPKKEMAVTMGLVEPVVRISFNKFNSRNQDWKAHDHSYAIRPLEEEEMVRLQALQVLGSLAYGGPAFLAPLHYGSALPAILSNLCPISNPPQIVLAALRALSNLAESAMLATSTHPITIKSLAAALFVRPHLASLTRIISQTSSSHIIQNQISLAATLIARICRQESYQQSLATSGVLDALAVRLASFVVAQGLVVPGADIIAHREAAWNTFNTGSLSSRQSQLSAIDYLLPIVPQYPVKSAQASAFPPLGSSGSREPLNGRGKSTSTSIWSEPPPERNGSPQESQAALEDPETPLVAYLIFIMRSREGEERLMASYLLTVLFRAGLINKAREPALGLLVVPLLVQMLGEEATQVKSKDISCDHESLRRTPSKATFQSKAMTKLSKLIKLSYEPVPESVNAQHWSPIKPNAEEDYVEQTPSSRLGDPGQSALLVHKIKVRESVLRAIASLIPFKEEHRKSVVDNGIIPYIVESLNPNPQKPSTKVNEKGDKAEKKNDSSNPEVKQEGYGINPVGVLIAACTATRALARSVCILRTTLIDNGVVAPIFPLLSHQDIEVQIAATAAVCNLLTDVAPMRESFMEHGVLKILCGQAHSANAKLRLNATWALKHFVLGVGNETKRACLEELGSGWLDRLICNDTEDEALLKENNYNQNTASGVDDAMDEDVEMDQFETPTGGSLSAHNNSRPSSSRSKSLQQAEAKLAALREAELNPAKRARKDDLAVQEQGLDFIRNLISSAGSGHSNSAENTEMIDYLFSSLGQDRVFEILASKLRPKIINRPSNSTSRGSSTSEAKVIPPQPEIIVAVVYILVHMAASIPQHRQIVIAQTELLKLLVPHFNNPAFEVRVAMCFLIANLTWVDDSNDGPACAQRVHSLKQLGILQKIENLEHDPELDVRERAKVAIWQMKAPVFNN